MKSWNRNEKMIRICRVLARPVLLVLVLVQLVGSPLVPEDLVDIKENRQTTLLRGFVDHYNPRIDPDERDHLIEAIIRESRVLKMPDAMRLDGQPVNRLHFVAAFVQVESHFQRTVVSSADARGYMQLMPDTARWLDTKYGTFTPTYRLFQTDTNIAAGVTYLSSLMEFLDNPRHVALAYNAGPGNLQNGIYTERYWVKIRKAYRELGRLGDRIAESDGLKDRISQNPVLPWMAVGTRQSRVPLSEGLKDRMSQNPALPWMAVGTRQSRVPLSDGFCDQNDCGAI